MRKRELNKLMGVAGRILLSFLFLFSQNAWAGQDQNTKNKADSAKKASAPQTEVKQAPAAPANAEGVEAKSIAKAGNVAEESTAAEEKPSGDGSHEGIKVHGHWTIEVRNPDGSVVTHREFENSLFPGPALAAILARQNSIGLWSIVLFTSTGVCNSNGTCFIYESFAPTALGPASFNLTTSVSGNTFVLTGTVNATGSGTITEVETSGTGCPATLPASTPCVQGSSNLGFGPTGGFIFTQASLNPGTPVSSGQTIAVTVNISFS
jgi:hypothetical protein